MHMPKRFLRGFIKGAAALAALVLVFDNRSSNVAGLVLLGCVAVLVICVLVWLKFDLGEDDWFSPRKHDR
jgi:hypothetical protein